MKPILISLNDLDEKPCEKYYDYIVNYPFAKDKWASGFTDS